MCGGGSPEEQENAGGVTSQGFMLPSSEPKRPLPWQLATPSLGVVATLRKASSNEGLSRAKPSPNRRSISAMACGEGGGGGAGGGGGRMGHDRRASAGGQGQLAPFRACALLSLSHRQQGQCSACLGESWARCKKRRTRRRRRGSRWRTPAHPRRARSLRTCR